MAFLASSSSQGTAHLCDPRSGSLIRTLKDCRACDNGTCASEHFVATAERDRSFVYVWSWGKEQPQYRCQAAERLTCVACTSDGAHCFAGAASGKLYLWQVASGRLLLAWDAHFKAATALSLCSDNFLISAGEDAQILAWNVAQLLQAAAEHIAPPPAMRSWTAHTLPISALSVAECGAHSLIASASLDQTVRLWRLSDSVRDCIFCVDFPSPLRCLAVHPLHASLYAGGTDGRIYPMPLLHQPHELLAAAGPAGTSRPAAASAAHDGAVRSLCVSTDGQRLFSCAGTGGVWVWDPSSLVLLQKLLPLFHADSLLFLPAPPLFADGGALALPPLLAPFKKYAEPPPEHSSQPTPLAMGCVPVRLGLGLPSSDEAEQRIDDDDDDIFGDDALPLLDIGGAPAADSVLLGGAGALASGGGGFGGGGGGGGGSKVAELREQVKQYRAISSELYQIAVQSSLAQPVDMVP